MVRALRLSGDFCLDVGLRDGVCFRVDVGFGVGDLGAGLLLLDLPSLRDLLSLPLFSFPR